MLERITFLTIGQTPRIDMIPEIVAHLPRPVQISEMGALDGLEPDQIAGLAPGDDDHALVSLLRDGRQVVIGKRWVTGRIQSLLDERASDSHEATVLLCTGDFSALQAPPLFLDSQHLVDHGVDALCHGVESVGLLVPLERQIREHHYRPPGDQTLRAAYASPYQDDDFEAAGRELGECDVIVMHCMGFTEAQREAVAEGSGRPVLLARRLVGTALGQLL